MTREEHIEEMAEAVICSAIASNAKIDDKVAIHLREFVENLYNAGYRKLPENIILIDFNIEAGMAFCTVMPRDEFVLNVSGRKAVEKNTVEEFAEKLKKKAFNKDMFNDWAGATYVVLVRDIDELLKQYGVEVEE